ncbi:MAG TPA: universal stress protein [Candidatus Binatia bacterium]|nr:universal stress protein [Candidatus Binatia bacterium]
MLPPEIVLCPIDFSELSRRELALAIEVCDAFDAHLVLHHNLAGVSPGFSRAWEWNEVHRSDQAADSKAENLMREILADLPKHISAEASISSGPLGIVLLQLASQLPADLVVLGSHGWSTEDHASVTERIIDRCPCPVLTVHEGDSASKYFRMRPAPGAEPIPVLVPTDLSAASRPAVDYALELARTNPLHLHLLHVAKHTATIGELDAAERRLKDLVPLDLTDTAAYHVQPGDPLETILKVAYRLEPAFMVMGEHARGFVRRFFTKDTAREALHRAPCPVWFVPARSWRASRQIPAVAVGES